MDDEIYDEVISLATKNEHRKKILKMTNFCEILSAGNIPDPYYEGASGFEKVLDLLEDATNGLLKKVMDDISQ